MRRIVERHRGDRGPKPARAWRMSVKALAAFHLLFMAWTAEAAVAAIPPSIVTYHYDDYRSGWNSAETILTPANVDSLALEYAIALDEQVDAQPLYVDGIVYVVTENNTVYAINPSAGAVVASRNLDTPVPMSALPGACNENSPVVGITSTPVIDPAANLLYLIAYTYENGSPIYRLHALHLGTLADMITPVIVTATASLSGNSTYNFNPSVSRQRAALLLSNGNIYAAFSSFCDFASNVNPGWVLGWNASKFAPLPANYLINRQESSSRIFSCPRSGCRGLDWRQIRLAMCISRQGILTLPDPHTARTSISKKAWCVCRVISPLFMAISSQVTMTILTHKT